MLMIISLLAVASTDAPILWRDVRAGMPADQIATLYPEAKGTVRHRSSYSQIEGVQTIGTCKPDVWIYYKAGVVDHVNVSSRVKGFPATTCVTEVITALTAKYGEPANRLVEYGSEISLWSKDGVSIRFERSLASSESWRIEYRSVADTGL